MKKLIALILVVVLISSILIACKSSNSTDTTTGTTDNSQTAESSQVAAETTTERIDPNLPDEDYGGYTFTLFAHRIDYAGDWVGDGDPRKSQRKSTIPPVRKWKQATLSTMRFIKETVR